jgi:(E)-4-hydroxy-3-methylbut-2-enyl-diphosphate synthase
LEKKIRFKKLYKPLKTIISNKNWCERWFAGERSQKKYGEPNSDALVESALRHVDILDRYNFSNFKLSLKASNIQMTVDSYRKFSKLLDQPLHLGITESGSYRAGSVKSSIGLGMLLSEGIGDTIRVSLASDPVDEVKIGWDILKSLNLEVEALE